MIGLTSRAGAVEAVLFDAHGDQRITLLTVCPPWTKMVSITPPRGETILAMPACAAMKPGAWVFAHRFRQRPDRRGRGRGG